MSTPVRANAKARVPSTDRLAAADAAARKQEEETGAASSTLSRRDPYLKPMKRSWFLHRRNYRAYALREASAVVMGLFVFNLLLGLIMVNAGAAAWEWWYDLQRNPAIVVINAVALIATVIHTVSWNQLTPSIIKVQRGTKFLPDAWITTLQVILLAIFATFLVLWVGGVF